MRLFCHLLGCHWKLIRHLPEDDRRWDRRLWKCARCGDRRPVWVSYRGSGRPDRIYTHG